MAKNSVPRLYSKHWNMIYVSSSILLKQLKLEIPQLRPQQVSRLNKHIWDLEKLINRCKCELTKEEIKVNEDLIKTHVGTDIDVKTYLKVFKVTK